MLGATNAVNLTDGIDGLATTITTIIIACLTVIGIILEIKEIVILGSILCGVNLGFLLFNMHPAKVFMGDTGSLALGGAVAICAICLKMPLILALVALVCIVDTISVMLQVVYFKISKGKRLFKMAPFHHHLELSGYKETTVVLIFWLITVFIFSFLLIITWYPHYYILCNYINFLYTLLKKYIKIVLLIHILKYYLKKD